ncbi:unnamed protein product [Clonostachys byssicola]|uniref:Uncharacterized protein n=1 Tax=Clonostachys byssicola TaxID=160290 RepID=A0A9N9U0K4_9HYPO|nr:unnamed protein product [Clonostachys byssicola]
MPSANGNKAGILKTGQDVRLLSRSNKCGNTSGLAPGYVQTNLIVLPSRYASDFRLLCARNTVPCPLVAESATTGNWGKIKSHLPGIDGETLAKDLDIRRDAPKYNVYVDGKLHRRDCEDIVAEWTEDHVAFLIGCSFSFETALADAGLTPPHTLRGRNVPMYRTTLPLCAAGVFQDSTYVVSMRSYPASEVERVRSITRPFASTHGEPVAWGWDALERLGIRDIDSPQWGDAPLATIDGKPLSSFKDNEAEVPVFWGCGVTPQEAVMRANLEGVVMAHSPGHMILLDTLDLETVRKF